MKSKIVVFCIGLLLLTTLVPAGCSAQLPASAPAPVKPASSANPGPVLAPAAVSPKPGAIVLKAMSWTPKDFDAMIPYVDFINVINERAKGELIIEHKGGPEAIPAFEQIDALRKGVIDFTQAAGTYYAALLPEVNVYYASRMAPWQERQVGFHDIMVERHKTLNMYFLGRGKYPIIDWWLTNKPVERPEDLKGQKVRAFATYANFIKAWGATMVQMPPDDVYSALERGVIDGTIGSFNRVSAGENWYQVVKYFIDAPVTAGGASLFVVNLDTWNKLPKHLQDLLADVAAEREQLLYSFIIDKERTWKQDSIRLGVKPIKFSSADAMRFIEMQEKVAWDEMKAKIPADRFAIIKKMQSIGGS